LQYWTLGRRFDIPPATVTTAISYTGDGRILDAERVAEEPAPEPAGADGNQQHESIRRREQSGGHM
jgi:hypothetical protein